MNRFLSASLATLLLVPVLSAQSQSSLESELDRSSYAIGYNIGQGIARDQLEINVELVLQGFRDAFEGNRQLLSDEEMIATLRTLQERSAERRQQRQVEDSQRNQQEGDSFLAENGKRAGVETLPSGLQYEVLSAGSGRSPTRNDTVTVHYRGTLINGSQFDSSYARGEPATFKLDGVIGGWTEALQLMKVGSKWKLFIPPALAYGERGTPGGPIGPNATLIFEIELLGVE